MRVLIVDDDKNNLELMREMIELLFPLFYVETAAEPEAIFKLLKNSHDIVICDLDIGSGLTGLDVVFWAKVLHEYTKTILMSGDFGAAKITRILGIGAKELGKMLGVDAFLDKPFDIKDFKRMIGGLINEGAS